MRMRCASTRSPASGLEVLHQVVGPVGEPLGELSSDGVELPRPQRTAQLVALTTATSCGPSGRSSAATAA